MIKVPEEVIVGRHFYIKPLLPLLDDAGPFWLLTISASGARFFQGSRWNFAEVPGVDLPQGVAAVRTETEYQETHYAAPPAAAGGWPRRSPLAMIRTRCARTSCWNFCAASSR